MIEFENVSFSYTGQEHGGLRDINLKISDGECVPVSYTHLAQGYEPRYGEDGFMMLVPAPQDLVTGEPNQSAVATVNIKKYD